MATNFVDVAVKKVKQKASELGKWFNTPSISRDSLLGKVTTAGQNYLQSPVGRVQQSFLQGGAQGASFGLAQPKNIQPTSLPEKVAQGTGFVLGAFNPYSLGAKGMGALSNVGGAATKGIISRVAPQATGFVASKLLPVVGQELAQTAGYGAATVGLGNKFNPVTDLAFGLGMRGALPGLGAIGRAFSKTEVFDNQIAKRIGRLIKEYDSGGKLSPDGVDELGDLVKAKLKIPATKVRELIQTADGQTELLRELRSQLTANQDYAFSQLPKMGFADTQPKGVGGVLKTFATENKVPPEKTITVYRGVGRTAKGEIQANDWVTQNKADAEYYMRDRARHDPQGGIVISKKVKASELVLDPSTNPGVTNEFRYSPTQPKGVGGEGIQGGTSSRKGNYKAQLDQDVAQISTPLLEKQLKGEISTPTKANQAVSSTNIIPEKGKLNLERLQVKGQAKKQMKTIESKVKPTIIGNKDVIQAAKTVKGGGQLTDESMKVLLAKQLKNRQQVVDLSVRYNEAIKNGATEKELASIMVDMVNQSRVARQGGTFAGRLLQAQNIIADESATPMQKILALLDNAGIKEDKYLKDAVKVDWNNPTQVVQFYRKFVPPKFGEVLDEIRYSNMLSSPLTHIINTTSNFLQTAVVAPVEKTLSGVQDWGKSVLTGSERKYYARSGIDYAGGYVKSLPKAFKKAWNVLSGSETLVKPDFERIPLGSKGLLKAYSIPLRALEAMDQFFKTLVEGGVTSELKHGPQKLLLSQIADKATKEANYRLFRQAFDPNGELGQGPVLRMFDKWNSAIANVRRLPGGKWVMPFLQTPTNILKQGIEYSPLGVSTIPGAKAPIEQLSRAIIGTGVFLGAYQLAQNGLTSWESPSSETERELYYAAGMQPYSVKIGDKWVSFSKLGPLSYPIAMAAALADAEKKNPDKDMVANLTSGVSGILGFFGDQSYVRSIGDLVDVIQGGVNVGPTALSAEGANLAGQLIPYKSFLTWLGRITDPTYRKASGFVDRLKKDIPIIGEKLEPYTDIYGKPSVRDYPGLNAVSPYKVTQEKPQEKQMLDKYQVGKVNRAVEKRADDAFQAGDKKAQVTGGIFRYIDDTGALKKIDTSVVTSLPSSTPYEKAVKEKKAYTLADNVLELPADQQAAVFAQLGISPEDAVYYNTAKQEVRLKSLYIDEEISKLDTSNRANLVNYLISQRKEVNGSMVLTNTTISELADKKIISDAEAAMLKNLKIVNGKPVTKLTGRGKKTALKKVSLPASTSKIKAPKIKSMSTLLKGSKLKVKKYKFRRSL